MIGFAKPNLADVLVVSNWNYMLKNLTHKAPIMTAADDKFGNNFPNFQKK